MNEAQRLWDECAGILQAQVSEPVWLMNFEAVRPTRLEGNVLTLAVPSYLAKERIEGRYLSLVRGALTEVGRRRASSSPLEIAAERARAASGPVAPARRPWPAADRRRGATTSTPGTPSTPSSSARPTASPTPPPWPWPRRPARKYNPLFIYGDAGLGKTHLLQAIAHYVRENYPTYRVRYVTSETFLNEFVDAIRTGTNDAFKRRYRDIDVLLVDDIQFIEGKKETQEEFFHTFNHLHQANRQIVLTSDRPPDAIGTLEDRLRSRFKQGLITDVQPPDLETRLAILRNKAEREATWIPPEVLEFIATNITDNIRVLEGALIRVAAFASLTAEQLTVETAGPGARRPPHRAPAPSDHPRGDPRGHLQDVRDPGRRDHRQEAPAPARRRPAGGDVRDAATSPTSATRPSPASSAAATTPR